MVKRCRLCGGDTALEHVTAETWWGGTLALVEDVPAQVCQTCGEQYFSADTWRAEESRPFRPGRVDGVAGVPGALPLAEGWRPFRPRGPSAEAEWRTASLPRVGVPERSLHFVLPLTTINAIIAGRKAITPDTALDLQGALGIKAEFWLNMEMSFQLAKARQRRQELAG